MGRVGGFYSPSAIRRHNGCANARVVHIFVGRLAFFVALGAFLGHGVGRVGGFYSPPPFVGIMGAQTRVLYAFFGDV